MVTLFLTRLHLKAFVICALVVLSSCRAKEEGSVNIAVAANFAEPAREIGQLFEQAQGHKAVLSFGSTGQLFTQITQDAPFEVFLAADQETPRKLVAAGLAAQDTLFTYAVGRLVLFSTTRDVSQGDIVLREGAFEKIAMANPSTAPYGAAAVETMKSLGIYEQLSSKVVQGNNIAQTFQFVESGSAELGFVALSQVMGKDRESTWAVPEGLYSPIRQDAVLLNRGVDSEAARAFVASLKSPEVLKVIEKYGYVTAP
jgi:molybdate transport system substrate-binding protein